MVKKGDFIMLTDPISYGEVTEVEEVLPDGVVFKNGITKKGFYEQVSDQAAVVYKAGINTGRLYEQRRIMGWLRELLDKNATVVRIKDITDYIISDKDEN